MWGRNDDGQFGVGNSIGMDMYESEKWPVESNLKDKVIKDVKIGENITVFLTEDNKVYVSGNKLWWSPHELKLPENEEITGIFCGDRFGGFITDYRNVYHVGSMFGNKETEEIINLSLWKVKDEVFPEGKILEIGGSYRNHYCFLEN